MDGAGTLTSREREEYRLGRRSLERGDTDAALAHFGRLLATREGFADVHYMVGLAYDQKDELDAAAESLEKALRINPSYAEAVAALSSVCERRGDFERVRSLAAATRRREAGSAARVARDPLDLTTRGKIANLQAAVGDAYREVGELREAIEAYRKALDRCPGFHDIRQRLAITLRDAGLPHQAVQELRRVLRAKSDHLPSAVQLGVTYYSLGRAADAVREWRAVLDREPDRGDAAMYLRLVREQGGRPPQTGTGTRPASRAEGTGSGEDLEPLAFHAHDPDSND